jgi:hypothetical protein
MNPKQKELLLIGVVFMLLMGLVPPWSIMIDYENIHVKRPTEYRLIFDPPESKGVISVSVDLDRLLVQWVAVGFVIVGGIFFFRDSENKPK